MSSVLKNQAWAVIPARGGSKGIPYKNIAPLAGRPLIEYAIGAAKGTAGIQHVFVSTDDTKIADVAKKAGAEIIHRPSDLSGDTASSESALIHAIETWSSQKNSIPEFTIFMQCTSPLTRAVDLDGALEKLKSEGADSVFAAMPSHVFLWSESEAGAADGVNHDKSIRLRRQDMAPQFQETGAFYAFRTEAFLKAKHRFFGKTMIQKIPPNRSIDIDEPLDLQIAEFLLKS